MNLVEGGFGLPAKLVEGGFSLPVTSLEADPLDPPALLAEVAELADAPA
jgi:hypothetical protein